ncbi:MAG: hypothetical protein K2X91_07740, partial [Thermoleophilia bacterium]|nr:hypothetical protein [Thermoleophilia bacterium]
QHAGLAADQGDRDLSALDATLNDLFDRRGEALLGLARHFLPEISRPAIEANFAGVRAELLRILARKEARERELAEQLARAEDEASRQDAELDRVTARLNELVARREELEARVAEVLKADADFQERSRLALQAEQKLHRDEQRAAEVRAEAAEKLPYYEKSALFRYLYDRGYATDDYQIEGLARTLDRWVARLISFVDARNGYEYLKKTPGLVDAEVARRRGLFADLMKQVEAAQAEAAERVGLAAVLREGDALGDTRDALVSAREPLLRQIQAIRAEQDDMARRRDVFYNEALGKYRDFLSETRLALLEQRSRQTPEPQDDALVAEIAEIDGRVEDLRPRLAEAGARRQSTVALRDALARIVQRYRQAEFDSQRSYFPDGFDIDAWLRDLETGAADPESLWASLRRHQRFRPHWVESGGYGAGEVLTGPAGRILIGAVLEAADAAMRDAAYRGVRRRGGMGFPTFPTFPTSMPDISPGPSAPPESDGGFTSGDGF